MGLMTFVRAVVTRMLFLVVSLAGVFRVTWVMKDPHYWFLLFLCLPLLVEMIVTLKRRQGQDYKWFSPPIFLFLISIIPSIWLLEVHLQENRALNNNLEDRTRTPDDIENKTKASDECNKFNSWNSLGRLMPTDTQNYLNDLSTICPNDWVLAFHQIVLILVILGKWLLPQEGGVTPSELSELLLSFIGTAADILEFTSETLSDIKEKSPQMVYIILAVWTWAMLQFPLHPSVVKTKSGEDEPDANEGSPLAKHLTDIWEIVEALFIQDGPFLVVRIAVMSYFNIYHQMLGFFAIKNFLVVILNLYRLTPICQDFISSSGSRREVGGL